MPLLKGQGCKAKPAKAIKYITDPKKAAIITSNALDDTRDYAKQFQETCDLFGKAKSYKSRKYYHFKHSFDPKDNITPEEATRLTEELAKKAFGDYEYIIATHTDRSHLHCHIIVNSVSFVTGKMLHLNNNEYGALKDLSNEIAEKYGYSTLDFRKPAEDKISTEEKHITLNAGTSWKEELREVIAEALMKCTTMEKFEKHLNQYGVTLARNTAKTISFKHPAKQKAIRGDKLGAGYTKEAIIFELSQHGNRTASSGKTAAETVESNKPTGIGEQSAQRDISGLYEEMERPTGRTNTIHTSADTGNGKATGHDSQAAESARTTQQRSAPRRR
ncbi:MAG: relaxase/mobilization nuclease domain-containing protein [Acutalibacteraceae bacterium]